VWHLELDLDLMPTMEVIDEVSEEEEQEEEPMPLRKRIPILNRTPTICVVTLINLNMNLK
jgi:hypothetical protein